VFAHGLYMFSICRKTITTRIMTTFEMIILRELLQNVSVIPINYDIMDLKGCIMMNISET
jgi:hypothetical protein